ncbi:hypothetical protein N657DRAFT_562980 [Parathielavia appendiculata]|uniref:Uncharacterized protein n=1 Tax=Parathielavia appendiculata TaxID=2587402 RepID=A0AAN6UD78_9PEZI|nr:hypothetical protein N657DRAFT_562980 [Parathielavia appendiculata]
MSEEAAILLSHRARARGLARIQAEQQRQQQQQQERVQKERHDAGHQEAHREQQTTVASEAESNDAIFATQWRPSIALGSPLWLAGEDLSAIEIADRKVTQTRLWRDYYRGAPDFVRTHQEALREREQLDETDEANIKPRSALSSTQTSAIQQRLRHLRVILQDSHFPPERANIEAAIAGYESGAIPYSDSYTLIWAGRIADRCPDFDSFTADRRERLARYEAEYGAGWLWYEPPLSGGGGTIRGPTIVLKRAICLENKAEWRRGSDNMGHYRVRMSFRRRKENVAVAGAPLSSSPFSQRPLRPRTPNTTIKSRRRSTTTTTSKTTIVPQPNTSRPGTTVPDLDGPRIVWNMLLDSGATLPCLFEGDLPRLGINRHTYAAQSSRTIATADSVIESRVYELDVDVCGGGADGDGGREEDDIVPPPGAKVNKKQHTHDENEKDAESLICTIPVVFFPGSSDDFINDHHTPDRLSGILPFHLCYLSSAPGNFKLWMGETKGDVVGAGRLPGMMRYGGVIGGARETESRNPPLPRTTMPKLVMRRASRNPKAPERTVSEHELEQDAGRIRWYGDVGDWKPIVSGVDLDHLNASAEDVDGLRAKRKRGSAHQSAQRRESVTEPARKKVERELRTEEEAGM